MEKNLDEQVMLERVELIARLTAEGDCHERDREVALLLIAEIARGMVMKNNHFAIVFSSALPKN